MQSKRDQVQAHAFVMNRLASGMLLADPDAPESPLGRTTRGAVIGVVVAVLVAAGAVVYGLISPGGNDSWRTSGTLVVNRETGARYVYYDGRLRPVRNYASARLIGGKDLKTEDVSTASLGDTPIGAPVGIPGAPDSLPGGGDLDSGAWQVCSALDEDGSAVTALVAGGHTTGTGLDAGDGVLVAGPDGASYLVWQGSRLRLDHKSGAAVSLGYGSVAARPVSAAFLDALVEGPDLTAPAVAGLGAKGPALGPAASRVGQVFRVSVPGSAERPYYQLRQEGLVPLTDTAAALALGDPTIREKAYDGDSPVAADLGADTLKQHLAPGAEGRSPGAADLPVSPPHAVSVPQDQAACARVEPGTDGTRVATTLVPVTDLGPVSAAPTDHVTPACLRVDGVVVRPGHGALVRALGADGTAVGDTTYLVTDNGVKYRVPSTAALEALGQSAASARALPAPLLSMLPTGPDLDPAAATGASRPHTTGPACGGSGDAAGAAAEN
ncbi:type VII secretion protein EccB [Streptomyces antibioticus]|nr:type VII secretion protein EccB [Streptomyces antibioticus]KUN29795.1 type VII secretion protein EccB [Streptomyces antibioticus]